MVGRDAARVAPRGTRLGLAGRLPGSSALVPREACGVFVGICVGSRFPFTQWIVSFAIDRDAPVVLRLLSGLLARPTRSAPFRRVPWSRE